MMYQRWKHVPCVSYQLPLLSSKPVASGIGCLQPHTSRSYRLALLKPMRVSSSSINLSSRGLSTLQSAAFRTQYRRTYRTHVMAVSADPPPHPLASATPSVHMEQTASLRRLLPAPPLAGGSLATLPSSMPVNADMRAINLPSSMQYQCLC